MRRGSLLPIFMIALALAAAALLVASIPLAPGLSVPPASPIFGLAIPTEYRSGAAYSPYGVQMFFT
jgi:hypothetical protein